MCEIESKLEFCNGVKETIRNSMKSLEKIEEKIQLEQQSFEKSINCAWEVPIINQKNYEEILKESGFEKNFTEILREEGIVELKLV